MISKEQIEKNQEKIRLKLAKERENKEVKANKKFETERQGKEKHEKRFEQASDRSELAVMIAEKIKGVISSELKDVISGIEKLKIDTPEIPEIELPEIVLPKIELPEIIIPEIKLPTITIPKIETPVIPDIVIPDIVLPKMPEVDTDKIIIAVIEGIQESFKAPLKVISVDEEGKLYEGRIIPGGGAYKWLKNLAGDKINPATEDKQDDIITGLDEVEILKNRGTISTNNSTTTPLGIGEVFTGVADNVLDYGEVNILVKTDQDSAVGGLSIEFSPDGTNWDEKIPVNITAGRAESYGFGNRADYFRIVYTNGGVAQGYFRLHATFHPMRTRRGARCLCVDIDPAEFAPTRRAVLAAKKPDGTYENIHSTAGANLKVSVEESELDFPIGTGSNGSVTLTSANTAYAIPATASTKNHILILYNGSDTDMFVGYENTNANGILLATGKTREFNLGISQQVYAYCASAGKVLTYSYKELNN